MTIPIPGPCTGGTNKRAIAVERGEDSIARIMDRVLQGTIQPGRVFGPPLPLRQGAKGYRATDTRRVLKTMLRA